MGIEVGDFVLVMSVCIWAGHENDHERKAGGVSRHWVPRALQNNT